LGGNHSPPPLAGAVGDLADDRGRRRRLGRSARAYVEAHFERRQQAERLEAMLTSLLCHE
jgi:glycosyltransferase involved in cell wall biosynthesis